MKRLEHPPNGRCRRPLYALVAALISLALVSAGCSSSGGGTSPGSSTAAGGSGTSATPGGGSSGGGSTSAGVAAAKALVAQDSKQPTQIPVTTPIGKPVPKGKSVYFVSCGTPNCAEEGDIIKQATDLLGWKLTVINTDGTPTTQKNAFAQVVRAKPDAVLYTAVNRSTFASDIPALKANGTFVAACCITDPVGNGIDYAVETPPATGVVGELQAAWIIADSNGTGNSVYVNLPAFPILAAQGAAYKAYTAKNCSSCEIKDLDIPVTSLGQTAITKIVSYLRANPSVKYVALSVDSIGVGLPAALKSAGLTDVKINGEGADSTTLEYLHAGQQGASVAFAYYEALWSMVDAVARKVSGVPVLPAKQPTPWLLTQSNAPNATKIFPTVADYEAQFKKIWGIS